MRTWHIVVASSVTAVIASGVLLALRIEQFDTSSTHVLLLKYWPGIAVVWLSVYGIAASALSTIVSGQEIRQVRAASREGWARRYLVRLEYTQYFTSVLALAGL